MTRESTILAELVRNGQWQLYHERRAKFYMRVATMWRDTALALAESDPLFAQFAVARGNENMDWSEEELQLAQQQEASRQ